MTYYAMNMLVLCLTMFWHVAFLIVMGFLSSFLIFSKIVSYENAAAANTDVEIDKGWKLLLFGLLYGAVDYLAGQAISVNQATILQMIGFSPQVTYHTTTYATTLTTP